MNCKQTLFCIFCDSVISEFILYYIVYKNNFCIICDTISQSFYYIKDISQYVQ